MTIQTEIEDFHMPDAGVAHNLVIVKIKKTYPGQGMKVISSLFGAGQMMFTKYLVVVSGDINIRNYRELLIHLFENTDLSKDLLFFRGPLDVLDHSSSSFSFGGKSGVDATIKHPEESAGRNITRQSSSLAVSEMINSFSGTNIIKMFNSDLFNNDIPVLIVTADSTEDPDVIDKVKSMFRTIDPKGILSLILIVDNTVDPFDLFMVAWQILGNSDPQRDHEYITSRSVLIDGTIKARRNGFFPRKWPNVVCSDIETISAIDHKWESLGLGSLVKSPSEKYLRLCRGGTDEIVINEG
jgi:4-hydroxy-3-polyprenylbenzoate decarboxylase